jgi:hypothetical protein
MKKRTMIIFLSGVLLATALFSFKQRKWERGLFRLLKRNVEMQCIQMHDRRDDFLLLRALHTCHYLMANRATVFNDLDDEDIFPVPASVDLMTTQGACGSYAQVLARLLQEWDYPVRIAQMLANGRYGGHNVVEVFLHNRWIVLDPTFDLYFVKPDSQLASFQDVSSNWAFYSRQLPNGYDTAYKYQGVRYMDWDKVPIITHALKKFLDWLMGKREADQLTLRCYLLDIYNIYLCAATIGFLLSILWLTPRPKMFTLKQHIWIVRGKLRESGRESA